eukprot:30886-Pelagococcus_subviridis.AAC.4
MIKNEWCDDTSTGRRDYAPRRGRRVARDPRRRAGALARLTVPRPCALSLSRPSPSSPGTSRRCPRTRNRRRSTTRRTVRSASSCSGPPPVRAEQLAHALFVSVVRDELVPARHVHAVHVGVFHRRRRRRQVHLGRARGAAHLHDLRHRRPADDGVVHEQHFLAVEHAPHRVELPSHGELARALIRHDERPTDVPVLHQPLAVRQLELLRDLDGARTRAVGHGHDDVDLPLLAVFDPPRESSPELELELVHADPVQRAVRPREINVLEDARRDLAVHALPRDHLSLRGDQDRLAGVHVADAREPERAERAVLARDAPLVLLRVLRGLPRPEHERADAVRVSKREEPDLVHHRDAAVRTLHLLHRLRARVEYDLIQVRLRVVRHLAGDVLRQDVEQDLAVAARLHHASAEAELELVRVREVAVVNEVYAERRVHEEGLRLRGG